MKWAFAENSGDREHVQPGSNTPPPPKKKKKINSYLNFPSEINIHLDNIKQNVPDNTFGGERERKRERERS